MRFFSTFYIASFGEIFKTMKSGFLNKIFFFSFKKEFQLNYLKFYYLIFIEKMVQ